jgi:hypothetical protein
MQQIRLEEEAMRASRIEEKRTKHPIHRPSLWMWIVPTFIKWRFCVGRQI